MTIRHKLSNIMLEVADHVSAHPDLYYRTMGSVSYDESASVLVVSGSADFLTYLNACPVIKWRRYAGVERVWLHLETSAVCCDLRVMEESTCRLLVVASATGMCAPRRAEMYSAAPGRR